MFDTIDLRPSNPYLSLLYRISKLENIYTEQKIFDEDLSELESDKANQIKSIYENFSLNVLIIEALKSGLQLSNIIKFINWKDFEKLISSLLNFTGWKTSLNFRFHNEGIPNERNRFEIDILAWKEPYVLLIDCKRYKKTALSPLKKFVKKQRNRVYELYEMIPQMYDRTELHWTKWKIAKLIPVIVTWWDHGLSDFENTPICSSEKFMNFIKNFDYYFELNNWFLLHWESIS